MTQYFGGTKLKSNKLGYLYVFLAAFFFALIAVIGKTAINSGISVYDLLILQYGLAFIILFIYFASTDIKKLRLDSGRLKSILLQGLIGSSLTNIFFYMALERMNAGIASMFLFTHPVLVSVYFLATKTKKITAANNFALIFAIVGSVLAMNIFNPELMKIPLSGIAFGIGASATYAFYNIYADLKLKKADPLVITFYTAFINCAVAIIINPGFFKLNFEINGQLIAYVVELAVISGILPVVFLYKGIRLVGAARASIVATAELPATLAISYLFLGETMGYAQLLGIFLIIAAIVILQNESRLERYFRTFDNRA